MRKPKKWAPQGRRENTVWEETGVRRRNEAVLVERRKLKEKEEKEENSEGKSDRANKAINPLRPPIASLFLSTLLKSKQGNNHLYHSSIVFSQARQSESRKRKVTSYILCQIRNEKRHVTRKTII
jgi:hypothetical protein